MMLKNIDFRQYLQKILFALLTHSLILAYWSQAHRDGILKAQQVELMHSLMTPPGSQMQALPPTHFNQWAHFS